MLALACAAGLTAPLSIHAQAITVPDPVADQPATADASGNKIEKFMPDYFTPFQASSALDMVFHVPGFNFNGGDNQVRGFAGAAGNVLIDGQRPASKSNLQDTLGNLSVAQVDHIELITGGAPGIDMQGYRQIVNVVRKAGGKPTIQFGGNVKTFPHNPLPAGFFSYASNKDGKTTDIYVEAFGFQDNGSNPQQRWIYTPGFSDPDPVHVDIPQRAGGTGHDEKFDHSRPFLGGKLSVNADYNPIDYNYDARYIQPGDTAVEHLDLKEITSEEGLQYERAVGKTLKADINVLHRHDRNSQFDVYTDSSGVSEYDSLALTSENITSAKLTWTPNDKATYKFGAENALNSADNSSRYTQNDTSQDVPSDKVRVEENRDEYYVTGNWQPGKTLSIEAGMKVETSTISVKPENRSKSFVYPKPELQLVWSPSDKMKFSWRTERVVGQLDFNDFASSVSLDTSVIKAGNPDIVPQKEWQNALTWDYSFWDKGAISLSYKHSALQDTLDFAPIVTTDGVFNARANIGTGTRDDMQAVLTLPTDRLHIKGGVLKIDYTRTMTSVSDPISHQSRAISNINPYQYVMTFDQNFPKIRTSWGIEIDSLNNYRQFNASDAYRFKSANWFAIYAEYRTRNNITFGVVVQNPMSRHDLYDRTVWTGLRDQTPLDHIEHNVSVEQPFLVLRIKKEM